jgi:hypothetical protein
MCGVRNNLNSPNIRLPDDADEALPKNGTRILCLGRRCVWSSDVAYDFKNPLLFLVVYVQLPAHRASAFAFKIPRW